MKNVHLQNFRELFYDDKNWDVNRIFLNNL